MTKFVHIVLAGVVALSLAVGAAAPAAAQECLGRREIQQRIDSGALQQLSAAMAAAGVDGKIISSGAEVCMIDGRLQWRVNVMDAYGGSRPVTLPAD